MTDLKKLAKNILAKLGFQLSKIQTANDTSEAVLPHRYEVADFSFDWITPSFKLAPWLDDMEFQQVYLQSTGRTLVDEYRCYELWQLVETSYKKDRKASLIEVGVWKGGTAAIIGKRLQTMSATVPFYACDTFSGVVKASDKDFTYKGGEHADTSVALVEKFLADKYKHIKLLTGIFPDETGSRIDPFETFSFCHIDVDVYESAKGVVDWIWDRLIIGGIIVFDDYGFSTCTGIIKFVNEQKLLTDRHVIYNLNGHAVLIKLTSP